MTNLKQPGIIITQPGISVETAADYQMIFNSNWPSLQIAYEDVVSITSGSSVASNHDLGIYPLTMVWKLINGISQGRIFNEVTFDKDNVYISDSVDATITYSIKCYNLDISKSVDYALPQTAYINRPYDKTFGIKVVKNKKSIASNDMRDFILHSRCQSPAVLSISTQDDGTITGGFNSITYTNPANYTPWVLGFISPFGNNNVYQCYPPGQNQAAPAFFQLGKKAVIWTNGTGGFGSLVVLRDPLALPDNIQVIY